MARFIDTEALGIYPSDVILRTAFKLALDDMRRNPYLLDFAFQALAHDDESRDEYGENEIERAKSWFLKTKIRVGSVLRREDPKFPYVTFDLMSSAEQSQEGTLGDTHYVPVEAAPERAVPVLAGPFTPATYDYVTGTMTVSATALGGLVLAEGMVVRTRTGTLYPIVAVTDDTTFQVAAGTVDDFADAVIVPQSPAWVHGVESAVFQEQVAVGCHVDSEAVHCIYLHAVVVFILKRYNQALFEARGFERMTISSANLRRDDVAETEFVYSRYVQVTGSVRQSWPKTPLMTVSAARATMTATRATKTDDVPVPIPVGDPEIDADEEDDEPAGPFSY